MAHASLRFQRNAQDYEEIRQGMSVFAGDAASFHEYQFRRQIKKSSCCGATASGEHVDILRSLTLHTALNYTEYAHDSNCFEWTTFVQS